MGDARPFLPIPDSLGCLRTTPGTSNPWHTHPFDELCLIEGSATTIGHAGRETQASDGTLYLFKRGERHRFVNGPGQSPRLWVLHYHSDDSLDAATQLLRRKPAQRIWRLSEQRAETFKALHVKILLERTSAKLGGEAAQSAWLRLLLIAIARWSEGGEADITPRLIDADLQQMWRILQGYSGEPAGLVGELKRQIPNYDSLRHRFRDVVGDSPIRVWSRLRMHQAKNLLLESSLSVKEIAARTGYGRQHEFARAFKKQFGVSPSEWRGGAQSS